MLQRPNKLPKIAETDVKCINHGFLIPQKEKRDPKRTKDSDLYKLEPILNREDQCRSVEECRTERKLISSIDELDVVQQCSHQSGMKVNCLIPIKQEKKE